MQSKDEAFQRLSRSPFRSRFHLGPKDLAYIDEKGMEEIRRHAEEFVHTRLTPADLPNDGRQTPMHGHPVFIAQHATACCCRGCLEKWYRVPQGQELRKDQEERIVNLLMEWIQRDVERQKGDKHVQRDEKKRTES